MEKKELVEKLRKLESKRVELEKRLRSLKESYITPDQTFIMPITKEVVDLKKMERPELILLIGRLKRMKDEYLEGLSNLTNVLEEKEEQPLIISGRHWNTWIHEIEVSLQISQTIEELERGRNEKKEVLHDLGNKSTGLE